MEIRVTFQELLKRIDVVEQTAPEQYLRSNFISGIKHLPVQGRAVAIRRATRPCAGSSAGRRREPASRRPSSPLETAVSWALNCGNSLRISFSPSFVARTSTERRSSGMRSTLDQSTRFEGRDHTGERAPRDPGLDGHVSSLLLAPDPQHPEHDEGRERQVGLRQHRALHVVADRRGSAEDVRDRRQRGEVDVEIADARLDVAFRLDQVGLVAARESGWHEAAECTGQSIAGGRVRSRVVPARHDTPTSRQ